MVWYKFWKRSGPMQALEEKYFWFDSKMDNGRLKSKCESWADSIGGGHNTYYRYGFKKVKHPPVAELERMIMIENMMGEANKNQLSILHKTLNKITKGGRE